VTNTTTTRLPLLPIAEAWRRLPGAPTEPGAEEPLPAWARMLVGPLPLVTARALELDAMHRTGDRLDVRLRCVARHSAASANGCDAGKMLAAADLARAGAGTPEAVTPTEAAVSAFARRLMTEAYAVTDAEVALLRTVLGEERLVALVALLAHASYQDRILLALDVPADEVAPPVTTRFARPKPGPPPALAVPIAPANAPAEPPHRTDLEKQKARPGRIRVPSREELLGKLGSGHPLAWQAGIAWSRVCYTFQPELTDAWFGTTGAFRQETDLDMVFQNSVFWVITERLRCFY
jgi:hypothetical protein